MGQCEGCVNRPDTFDFVNEKRAPKPPHLDDSFGMKEEEKHHKAPYKE